MVQLDYADEYWAWRLGLTYGGWYPDLDVDLHDFGAAWREYSEPKLNDVAASYGRRQWKLPADHDLTDLQITALLPYLQELSQKAAYSAEIALYYRRDKVRWRKRDPRLEYPNEVTLDILDRNVRTFLIQNPALEVHLGVRVRPVYANGAELPAPPPPQPYGVSHAGAEHFAAAWMQHLGALDARPTQYSGDGGIDVVSSKYVAQVKNLAETAAVPVAAIRDLAGVASVDKRRAVMFTSGLYSAGGVEFANSAGIALFRYNAMQGTLTPANELANGVLIEGMG